MSAWLPRAVAGGGALAAGGVLTALVHAAPTLPVAALVLAFWAGQALALATGGLVAGLWWRRLRRDARGQAPTEPGRKPAQGQSPRPS